MAHCTLSNRDLYEESSGAHGFLYDTNSAIDECNCANHRVKSTPDMIFSHFEALMRTKKAELQSLLNKIRMVLARGIHWLSWFQHTFQAQRLVIENNVQISLKLCHDIIDKFHDA